MLLIDRTRIPVWIHCSCDHGNAVPSFNNDAIFHQNVFVAKAAELCHSIAQLYVMGPFASAQTRYTCHEALAMHSFAPLSQHRC